MYTELQSQLASNSQLTAADRASVAARLQQVGGQLAALGAPLPTEPPRAGPSGSH